MASIYLRTDSGCGTQRSHGWHGPTNGTGSILRTLGSLFALVCACCACAAHNPSTGQSVPSATFYPPLADPAKLAAECPPLYPALTSDGQLLYGAYALQQYPGGAVEAEAHRLRFMPDWEPGPGTKDKTMAYAIFCFNLEVFDGVPEFKLNWEGSAPQSGELYLGLGDFWGGRWDWYKAAEDSTLALDSLDIYTNLESRMLLAVVLLGTEQRLLDSVLLGERWIAEGVDLTMVFAPPVQSELDSVEQDWAGRSQAVEDVRIIGGEATVDDYQRTVLSHIVDGHRHYGYIRRPLDPQPGNHPVVLMLHPGNAGVSTQYDILLSDIIGDQTLVQQYVVVVPSFRGETLSSANFGALSSGGSAGMYDRDADDAMALLNVALEIEPACDPERIIAIGYSRGAQVAVRVGERDPRIKAVVELAGWTDEWCQPAQSYMLGSLASVGTDEPELDDIFTHFYWDLKYGSKDIWKARNCMLHWSVVYWAEQLNRVHIHHGDEDTSVPIDQGLRLANTLMEVPGSEFQFIHYPGVGHDVINQPGMQESVTEFLLPYAN